MTGERCIMAKNLYVGNLPFGTTTDQLRAAFRANGTVTSRPGGCGSRNRPFRGFGFVEMESGADEAITKMNGADVPRRNLTVNEAKPREPRAAGGGGGGYGGGGGGGGGRGGYGGGGGGGGGRGG